MMAYLSMLYDDEWPIEMPRQVLVVSRTDASLCDANQRGPWSRASDDNGGQSGSRARAQQSRASAYA
jgi:hypothetical protein